jgi:ATP-dependent Lon protease
MPTAASTQAPAGAPAESSDGRGALAIAIAGFKQVYSTNAVGSALEELSPTANEALRATYEKMIRAGGERFCVKPAQMPDFDALEEELPNFAEPLADLRRQLALCLETEDTLEITPMLLLGEPGIGKTHFARKLSKLLGTGYGFVPMSSLTAGWVLSGASSQWRNAKTGKVFDTAGQRRLRQPGAGARRDRQGRRRRAARPARARCTGLLEQDTAREFVDEFAEVPIDCSEIVWIATANDAGRIPSRSSTG